jgi:hypothetical protein
MAASEGGVQPCSLLGPPTSSDDLSSSSDSHSDADYLLDKEADTPPYTPEMERLQYDMYLKQIEASHDNLHDLILFDMAPTTQTDVGNNIGNA